MTLAAIHDQARDCQYSGYKPEHLIYLDEYFQTLISHKKIQCASYAISMQGQPVLSNSFGPNREKGRSKKFSCQSIRRIASITKLVTAVAIMQLIEKGLISLATPVKTVLSEFETKEHQDITIFELLTHTSGILTDPGNFGEAYPFDLREILHRSEDWITEILRGPLTSKPGIKWEYCSTGFVLLGEIVARLSGLSYQEYVYRNIFQPLEMRRTFYEVPAKLHNDVCFVSERDREIFKLSHGKQNNLFAATGDLYSTTFDLMNFAQMMLGKGQFNGKRILARKSIEAMTRPQLPKSKMAEGWLRVFNNGASGITCFVGAIGLLGPQSFFVGGGGISFLCVDPEEELVAIFFAPSADPLGGSHPFTPIDIIWAGIT